MLTHTTTLLVLHLLQHQNHVHGITDLNTETPLTPITQHHCQHQYQSPMKHLIPTTPSHDHYHFPQHCHLQSNKHGHQHWPLPPPTPPISQPPSNVTSWCACSNNGYSWCSHQESHKYAWCCLLLTWSETSLIYILLLNFRTCAPTSVQWRCTNILHSLSNLWFPLLCNDDSDATARLGSPAVRLRQLSRSKQLWVALSGSEWAELIKNWPKLWDCHPTCIYGLNISFNCKLSYVDHHYKEICRTTEFWVDWYF